MIRYEVWQHRTSGERFLVRYRDDRESVDLVGPFSRRDLKPDRTDLEDLWLNQTVSEAIKVRLNQSEDFKAI